MTQPVLLSDITFTVECTPGGWNEDYWVIVKLSNNSNTTIEYEINCVETVISSGAQNYIPLGLISSVPRTSGTGYLDPGDHILKSGSLKKDWEWWTEGFYWFTSHNCETAWMDPDTGKVIIEYRHEDYNYKISLRVIIENGDDIIFDPIEISKTVAVSEEKCGYASYASEAYIGWWEIFIFTCCTLGMTSPITAPILAYLAVSANYWKEAAKDPIEFDKNFKELSDSKKLPKERRYSKKLPSKFKDFLDIAWEIPYLNQNIKNSYAKYLSALKMNDKESAKLQFNQTKKIFQDYKKSLEVLEKIKFNEEDLKPMKMLERKEALKRYNDYREKGVPFDLANQLIDDFNEDKLKDLNSSFKKAESKGLDLNLSEYLNKFHQKLFKSYQSTLIVLEKMEEINKLPEKNLKKRLFQEGILNVEEYYTQKLEQ